MSTHFVRAICSGRSSLKLIRRHLLFHGYCCRSRMTRRQLMYQVQVLNIRHTLSLLFLSQKYTQIILSLDQRARFLPELIALLDMFCILLIKHHILQFIIKNMKMTQHDLKRTYIAQELNIHTLVWRYPFGGHNLKITWHKLNFTYYNFFGQNLYILVLLHQITYKHLFVPLFSNFEDHIS